MGADVTSDDYVLQVRAMVDQLRFDRAVRLEVELNAVNSLELQLGLELPAEVRDLIERRGGNRPGSAYAPVYGKPGGTRLNGILDVGDSREATVLGYRGAVSDVLGSMDPGNHRGIWPALLVPICGGPSDGVFCLDFRTDLERPPMIFVDFLQEEGRCPLRYSAPSFGRFIELIDQDDEHLEIPDDVKPAAVAWTAQRDIWWPRVGPPHSNQRT